jgi:predicted TIM-barrel fold metal-dependent hydrolase
MRIFDSHTHVFPDKIADKATAGIGGFYDMPTRCGGTVADLTSRMKESNICGGLICSVATDLAQVSSINDFIGRSVSESDLFVGFASLHPQMTESETDNEIKRAVSMGLRGIKLHPDFQRFEADGKTAFRIYEVIDSRLPVLIHAGDKRFDFSSPGRIANALKRFPDLVVIAAHFGGWSEWEDAILSLAGREFSERLFVDTSSSLYALSQEKALEYISAFGDDRVLFGTDYPMWDLKEELERFDKLNLSDSAREKILYSNAEKLLKL